LLTKKNVNLETFFRDHAQLRRDFHKDLKTIEFKIYDVTFEQCSPLSLALDKCVKRERKVNRKQFSTLRFASKLAIDLQTYTRYMLQK
jgi:hypothetical protein